MRRAASGQSGADAVAAVATAYHKYAGDHSGNYVYLLRTRAGDAAHSEAAQEILDPGAVIDAARFLRSALHGFATLEIAGGFAMARPADTSFDALRGHRTWPVVW